MRDHNYCSRAERCVVMNDHEIEAVSRCYACGGHHISGDFRCSPRRLSVAVLASTVVAAVLAALLFL
jgi:hypothetical protein